MKEYLEGDYLYVEKADRDDPPFRPEDADKSAAALSVGVGSLPAYKKNTTSQCCFQRTSWCQ